MGAEAYEKVWGPLLRGKFGDRADDISMAWLWGKLTMRRKLQGKESRQELLGYPRRSWEPLFAALRERIEAGGGRVLIDRPVEAARARGAASRSVAGAPGSFRPGHDPRALRGRPAAERYDAVVATVPNDVFRGLLDVELARRRLPASGSTRIEYHTALCLLLELDRSFTPFYWTNIADPELPFVGVIEHTNLIEPERYGGRRFLYVANYLAPGPRAARRSTPTRCWSATSPGLRRINPALRPRLGRERWLHREPAAQPIVTVGYGERIPPLQTGVPGLVLANTTQIYPEDRGTNYAVRLGDRRRRGAARRTRSARRSAAPTAPTARGPWRRRAPRSCGDDRRRAAAHLAAARRGRRRRRRGCSWVAANSGRPGALLAALREQPVADRHQAVLDRVAGAALQLGRGVAGVRGDGADRRAGLGEAALELEHEQQVGELGLAVGGPAAGRSAAPS